MSTFDELLTRYVGRGWDQQVCFAKHLDYQLHAWVYDVTRGELGLPGRRTYRAQILGTESAESKTWLWAWANPSIPTALTEASLQLREIGTSASIAELTRARLPADDDLPLKLATIALGRQARGAAYRGVGGPLPIPTATPFSGNVWFLIDDPAYPEFVGHPGGRIAATFPQAVRRLRISDHRVALAEHCASYGMTTTSTGNEMAISQGSNTLLIARFDDDDRLLEIEPPPRPFTQT
jgi:hypothetical protein